MAKRHDYAVIHLRQFTGSQVGLPELFFNKSDAEDAARRFNRCNQDKTWNAVVAYVVSLHEPLRA